MDWFITMKWPILSLTIHSIYMYIYTRPENNNPWILEGQLYVKKIKGWKRMYHSKVNLKVAWVAILALEKVDSRAYMYIDYLLYLIKRVCCVIVVALYCLWNNDPKNALYMLSTDAIFSEIFSIQIGYCCFFSFSLTSRVSIILLWYSPGVSAESMEYLPSLLIWLTIEIFVQCFYTV